MKSDRLRRSVALYTAIILILLSGTCFSDEFDYLQTPSKTINYHAIYNSTREDPYISDEFPGIPAAIVFIDAPVVDHHLMRGLNRIILLVSLHQTPSKKNNLFLFLSTYRI